MNHDNDDSEYGHHNTDITHDDSDSSHCLVATSLWLVFQRKELKSHYRWLVMASVTSHQSGIRDRSHPRAILIQPITTPRLSMMGCQPSDWPCKRGMLSQWSRHEQAIDFYKDSYRFKAAMNIQKIDLRSKVRFKMKPKDESVCLVCAGANYLPRLHLSSSGDLCRSSLRPWARDPPGNFWFGSQNLTKNLYTNMYLPKSRMPHGFRTHIPELYFWLLQCSYRISTVCLAFLPPLN